MLKASLSSLLIAISSGLNLITRDLYCVLMSLPANATDCKHDEIDEDREGELLIEVPEELQTSQVGGFVPSVRKASHQIQRGDAVAT